MNYLQLKGKGESKVFMKNTGGGDWNKYFLGGKKSVEKKLSCMRPEVLIEFIELGKVVLN